MIIFWKQTATIGVDIVGRYRLMAELRKIDIFALRKQMYQNCCNFFNGNNGPSLAERTSLLVGQDKMLALAKSRYYW